MDIKKFSSIWDVGKLPIGTLMSNPFDGVKDALFDYKSQPDPEKARALRMLVQSYLREMNANQQLPLSHRLMVMDTLDQYIGILQELNVPNLLETYDKVMTRVTEKAEKKPEYVEALVEMAVYSFYLIVHELQHTLLRYYPVSRVSIRRALATMDMVLRLYRKHQLPANNWFVRLSRLFIIHELLRTVNTYAMPPHEQQAAVRHLRKHLDANVKVGLHFYFRGEAVRCQGLALIVRPLKPHISPSRVLRYDEVAEEDTIVLDLDQLAQIALRDMRHAQSKINPGQQGQHGDYVMIADALKDTIVFGQFMREVMYTRPRQYPRKRPDGKKYVALDTGIDHGFRLLYEQQRMMDSDGCIDPPERERVWQVVDISDGGFYLEHMPVRQRPQAALSMMDDEKQASADPDMEVGILISYALLEPVPDTLADKTQVKVLEKGIARVSWYRIDANELRSIGVAKIMRGNIAHVRVVREMLSVSARDQFFAWIDREDERQLRMWSTQEAISPGTPLSVRTPGKRAISCSVAKMLDRGVNYAVHLLNIDPPKEAERAS